MAPRKLTSDEADRLRQSLLFLQTMVQEPGGKEAIGRRQQAGFTEVGLRDDDRQSMVEAPLGRIHVYRRLVRSNFVGSVKLQLCFSVRHWGDTPYRELAHRYLTSELPTSQVQRDIAYEFGAWACDQLKEDMTVPVYLRDLIRFELMEFDCRISERDPKPSESDQPPTDEQEHELGADSVLIFNRTTRLARLSHAVHRLDEDQEGVIVPDERACGVLGYCDQEHRYHQLELTPIATSIFELLLIEQLPLAAAVQKGCDRHKRPLDEGVFQAIGNILEDLGERGSLIGIQKTGAQRTEDPSPCFRWFVDGNYDLRPTDF